MTAASAAQDSLYAVLATVVAIVGIGAWLIRKHLLRAQVGPESPATEAKRKTHA